MKKASGILVSIFFILSIASAQFGKKLPVVIAPKFKKDTLSIIKYGAIPEGHTLNTKSINAAIEVSNKKGGGVVLVPEGLWLTGPVVLKSNVNLHLAARATLLFTADKNQYPLGVANWEGLPQMRNQSPISATGASDGENGDDKVKRPLTEHRPYFSESLIE